MRLSTSAAGRFNILAIVARDSSGEIYTVRYEAVNAMLLNEFQKQHQRVKSHEGKKTEIEQRLAAQAEAIAVQEKELKNLSRRTTELLQRMQSAMQKVHSGKTRPLRGVRARACTPRRL